MKKTIPIAVTSRSFSTHPILRQELLATYADVKFNDAGEKLEGEKLVAFLNDRAKVIAGLERYDSKVIAALPTLQVISRFGVGLDNLDLQAMSQFNVNLGWAADTNALSVAEMTLSFMLALLRNSFVATVALKNGSWQKFTGNQLTGKTIGIIGAGHVGRVLIKLLQPFQCRILINDITIPTELNGEQIEFVDFETILSAADIISLHVPLTTKTSNMINAASLAKMQKTAYLINTARGGLVDQVALKNALLTKQIAGAALDVFQEEPPLDSEFLTLPNLICTPHLAGNSYEAEMAMGRAAIQGLEKHIASADFIKIR